MHARRVIQCDHQTHCRSSHLVAIQSKPPANRQLWVLDSLVLRTDSSIQKNWSSEQEYARSEHLFQDEPDKKPRAFPDC